MQQPAADAAAGEQTAAVTPSKSGGSKNILSPRAGASPAYKSGSAKRRRAAGQGMGKLPFAVQSVFRLERNAGWQHKPQSL
jgi:hypothetical protein